MRMRLSTDTITQSIYVHLALPEIVQRTFGSLPSLEWMDGTLYYLWSSTTLGATDRGTGLIDEHNRTDH